MRSAKKSGSWIVVLLCWMVVACQGKLGAGVTGSVETGDGDRMLDADGSPIAGDGDSNAGAGGPRSGDGDASGSGDGDSGASGTGDGDGAMPPPVSAACLGAVFQSSGAPLRRLSATEYGNTVADLFPGVALPALELVPDARVDGFDNAAAGQSSSALAVERFAQAAETLAGAVVANRSGWAPCTADTAECVRSTLLSLAERAYRHPLSSTEQTAVSDLANGALGLATPREALALGVEALLQAPDFLYRPEFGSGTAVGDGAVALSPVELANRLSYFLWGSMPDATLLAAARDGGLESDVGLRAEAERMLADPRARPALTDFFVQWLGLYKLDQLALDPGAFPELDESLRQDLRASAELYIAHALWEADSFQVLMAGNYGFVNDRIAPLFGVPAPGTNALTYTELDATERRGILTQPGMLAATSHGIRHSPILRGVQFLNNVLCANLPAPPPGALQAESLPVDPSLVCTTRDEVAMTHTAKPGCNNCHNAIDAAGFNFENYDALGRYRTRENGCAVDATGSYPGTDLTDSYPDAVALAQALPDSTTVTSCVAEQLFRFGLGRASGSSDACEIESLGAQLLGGGDSMQELVIALVMTPSFRSRPPLQ